MGINETIKRYENTKTYTLDDFVRLSEDEYFYYMFSLYQTYYIPIIKSIHLDKKSEELIQFFTDKNFLLHFFEDCKRMIKIIKSSSYFVLKLYSNVIFENGQGLGLDDLIDIEYGTPTRTGITYAQDIIERIFTNETIFVNYITRSYVTRHGEGYLENPYNSNNIDLTNIRNDFQGSLRYGYLDDSTFHRIYNDISIERLNNEYKNNLIITHYNNNFKLTSDQTRMFYNILGIKDKYGKQQEVIKGTLK
jgi:adenylosuccinate synthase